MNNVYSCQNCGLEFDSDKIYIIYEKVSPVCSDYCFFMVVHSILSKYSEEQLLNLGIVFKIEKLTELNKNEQIYEYSKRYKKALISFINKEVINYQNAI